APEHDAAEATALQDAHLAYIAALHEAGDLVAAGPLADDELRGLSIFSADPERARALAEADPAVKAGRFSIRVLPWMLPAGAMAFMPTFFPRSVADVRGE